MDGENDNQFEYKVRRHPSARTPPLVVVEQLRELVDAGKVKAVGLFVLWNDDSYETDWSVMSVKELVTGARLLSVRADEAMLGNHRIPPKKEGEAS